MDGCLLEMSKRVVHVEHETGYNNEIRVCIALKEELIRF